MSVSAITWAFGLEGINPARKFVLVTLANYADENNSCFPGQDKLARDVGTSVSTIRRALKELEDGGYIVRERRYREDGYRSSDRYFLQVNMTASPKSDDSYRSNQGTLPVKTEDLTGHSYERAEPSEEPKENRQSMVPDFVDWYLAYPRKEARGAAERAYAKAVKSGVPPGVLLAGAQRYANDPNRERQYTKLPATWLNGKCWDDDPLPPKASKPPAFAGRGQVQEWD